MNEEYANWIAERAVKFVRTVQVTDRAEAGKIEPLEQSFSEDEHLAWRRLVEAVDLADRRD